MEKGRLAHQSASDHLRDRRTFETVLYCFLTFESLVVAQNHDFAGRSELIVVRHVIRPE
jgi:hypothetical protein